MGLLKNAKNLDTKLDKARDKKCEPIAQEIIQIIAKHNICPKALDNEGTFKLYSPVATEINILMKDKGVTVSEVNYIWSIVQAVLDEIKKLSTGAVQGAMELAEKKLFSVDEMRNITLQQVDNVLLL